MIKWSLIACCLAQLLPQLVALDNGLALTPPMGWLAWERYVCETDCNKYPNECIDQGLFESMAEQLVADGYAQLGYQYVNIDDCWSKREREPTTGQLSPDPARFPSMRALADKIHSLGLKLGIYGDCGTRTCQNFPGQLESNENLTGNHFESDAQTFAEWQIDSFKFDGCYMNANKASQLCPPMGVALNKTGRAMLFSCSWPAYENDLHLPTNWTLVEERCNLWRAFGDIEDSWQSVLETIDWFVRKQDIILAHHGPGHWFDADQLVIGDFGLSRDQERAHMAIWCVWASPLYMSNDLRKINKESSRLLRNKWLIEVNQDPMGIFGLMVLQAGQLQVFAKPVGPLRNSCPSYAIVYLDRRTLGNGKFVSFPLIKIIERLHAKLSALPKWASWYSDCLQDNSTVFNVNDLFNDNSKIGQLKLNGQLELRVDPSGAQMVKLTRL